MRAASWRTLPDKPQWTFSMRTEKNGGGPWPSLTGYGGPPTSNGDAMVAILEKSLLRKGAGHMGDRPAMAFRIVPVLRTAMVMTRESEDCALKKTWLRECCREGSTTQCPSSRLQKTKTNHLDERVMVDSP